MATIARTVTNSIKDYLTLKSWHVQKCGSTASFNSKGQFYRTGEVGQADIQAHHKRVDGGVDWLCCEIKASSGDTLRESQTAWLAKARNAGAIIIVAHNLDEFVEHLNFVMKENQ